MWKKYLSKINLLRFLLAAVSIAVILLVLPHADRKGFTYEQNQPWKYPLLTADFDIPILRDSTSIKMLRDSIDRSFVPFVKRDIEVENTNIERFSSMISGISSPEQARLLTLLLKQTYQDGVLDNDLIEHLRWNNSHTLRLVKGENEQREIVSMDASPMFSERRAYIFIDSSYNAKKSNSMPALSQELTKAINLSLSPNIILDSLTDTKFRDQEYLTVNGALGVIKTGQRIVDRGEIPRI